MTVRPCFISSRIGDNGFPQKQGEVPQSGNLSLCLKADTYLTLEVMHLTDEQITQFQRLYKKHFGADISKEQAHEEGIKLVRLMQLIYKPMPKEECEALQN